MKSYFKLLAGVTLVAASSMAHPVLADTNRLCATGNTSDCFLIGNFPPEIIAIADLNPEDDGATVIRYIDGEWSMNGRVIGHFGGPGWTPVIGNWHEDEPLTDEFDNIGVYKNGLWIYKNSWNFVDPGFDVTFHSYGDSTWSPVVGNWSEDGESTDSIGLYKDGVFKIRHDSDEPASEEIITFNLNPSGILGVVARPIAGHFNSQLSVDNVGIIEGYLALYSDLNTTATYDLYDTDPNIVQGTISIDVSNTKRPLVDFDDRIVFVPPPKAHTPDRCPPPSSTSVCEWVDRVGAEPNEGGGAEIPVPQPF